MAHSSIKSMNVLMLGHPDEHAEFIRLLGPQARFHHVASFEEALEALRCESFDLVVSRAADFPVLCSVDDGGHAAAVLDAVNQGVCMLGESGQIEWANPKLLNLPEDVRTRIRDHAMETLELARKDVDAGISRVHGRRYNLSTDRSEQFEVTATPVVDSQGRVTRVVAVVRDTTNARRLQNKIDAIDRAGRELLSLDAEQFSRLNAQERLALLEEKIRCCTEQLLHFDNFEVRIVDKNKDRLELVLAAGMPSEIHEADLHVSQEGNGICGYVASRGRSYICPDASNDPRYLPGIKNCKSSLTVPLFLREDVVGVANFESKELASFNEDDRQFAEIFGRYIALSLHILELLVSERHTTVGRVGQDVMAGITGPINDILTDVEGLVEDYIGHDDLRHRLRKISEYAVAARESTKSVTSSKPGLLGIRSDSRRTVDPALKGKRVLVADDEDMIRDTVRDVLIGYGCEVSTARDGADAIELIGKQPFDLVLSDIKMPNKTGYEVFAAAKEANASTPVILTTGFGYDPNHTIIRARREGLAAVLFKPFKVDQLLGEIRMALGAV